MAGSPRADEPFISPPLTHQMIPNCQGDCSLHLQPDMPLVIAADICHAVSKLETSAGKSQQCKTGQCQLLSWHIWAHLSCPFKSLAFTHAVSCTVMMSGGRLIISWWRKFWSRVTRVQHGQVQAYSLQNNELRDIWAWSFTLQPLALCRPEYRAFGHCRMTATC